MTSSELNRKLLFCGYSDLTDYLRNSPLNRYLYKMLLIIMEQRRIEVPITTMLREIYYQCIRVRFDNKPGVNVRKRYFEEEAGWVKSEEAAKLIFEIVWMLFQQKRKLSFHEECFIEQLSPIVKQFDCQNHQSDMLADMRKKDIRVPDEFVPMPCPVEEIPMVFARDYETEPFFKSLYERFFITYGPNSIKGENMWRVVTDNFAHSSIEKYVNVYTNPEDQIDLLHRIQFACTRKERDKHEDFFIMLGSNISASDNEHSYICCQVTHQVGDVETKGEFGFVGKAAQEYLENFSRELRDVANQYKQERDEARQQAEEQKKSQEMEIAKIEAKYQAEIQNLKKERNRLAHEEQKKSLPVDSQELTLTLSEMVTFVKERFSKPGADEISTMLYRKAVEHGNLGEDIFKQIDDIIPFIIQRDKPQQKYDIKGATQVNINTQRVINGAT